jgi:hypothetical protein
MKVDKITNLEGKELNKDTELKVGDEVIIHSGSERYHCKVVFNKSNQYYIEIIPIYSVNNYKLMELYENETKLS